MKRFLLIFCSLLVVTANAQTTYYVNASTGDNSNDGLSAVATSESGPLQTINAALGLAMDGDYVSVESGNYSEDVLQTKDIVLLRTGSESVTVQSWTFSFGGNLLEPKPVSGAFNCNLVTVNNGSILQDGEILTAAETNLAIAQGTYPDALYLTKSLHLILANPGVQIANLYLNGFGAEVYLEGAPLTITESIRFNQTAGGRIFLGNTNILVGPAGSIYAGAAGSYAVADGGGKFYSTVSNGPAIFPVGTIDTYAPVTITPQSGESGILGVSVRPAGNPNSFNPDLPLNVNRNVKLEWTVTPTGTNISGSIRFDYNGTAEPTDWTEIPERIVASALVDTYTEGTNIEIGESYSQADFALLSGVFAIYSNFPNAIPTAGSNLNAHVYPNPFSDNFQLTLNGNVNEEVSIEIMDISGRIIAREIHVLAAANTVVSFNALQNQNSGLYLIRILSGKEVSTLRAIKN
jgi:hypothetical protein